jgi:hypothetical protein
MSLGPTKLHIGHRRLTPRVLAYETEPDFAAPPPRLIILSEPSLRSKFLTEKSNMAPEDDDDSIGDFWSASISASSYTGASTSKSGHEAKQNVCDRKQRKQNTKILHETMEALDHEDSSIADILGMSMSASSYTGASTSKSGQEAKQNAAGKEMRDKIIKKEEAAVRKARMIVIGGFIACATAVSVAVYKFASKADFRSFELEVREGLEERT